MRPVFSSISVDAPRERVFDLLEDLSIRPAFTDHFLTGFRLARVDPVGPGAAARFCLRDSGVWLDTVIDGVERPHLIREHGHGGRSNRVPAFTVWELAEGPGPDTTEASVTFWTEPGHHLDRLRELFGPSRHFRRGWHRALERLKELAETGQPVERVVVAGADTIPSFNP